MRGELVFLAGNIDYLRRRRDLYILYGDSSNSEIPEVLARLIPSGWFYQNQVRCSRFMVQYYLPVVDLEKHLVSRAAAVRADETLNRELRHLNPYNWLGKILLPALGPASKRFAAAQSAVDLARVACALERHRLAQGCLPETLDALIPQFIKEIPHDIINGQPLHYRRTGDGQFTLYAVGWNETDDGGRIGLKEDGRPDPDDGDWVWP
jgi:hypothetical protein